MSQTGSGLDCSLHRTLQRLREILEAVKDPMTDDWDPALLGFLLAKLEYENLDVEAQMQAFQGLVESVRQGLPRESSLREQTAHVIEVYAKGLGFSGDKNNYYNIKNSFLNDVLLRRKGIPISLSLVFMALARGVGLRAVGISFPGHFLVRMVPSLGHFDVSARREEAEDWTRQWFIDCFDAGALMTVQDCERRLREWTRGVIPFGPDVLQVAHPTEIVSRMLRNLRAIFMEKEDLARLYWVLTALIELCPQDRLESIKDRGILFARTGRYGPAAADLKEFLALSDDATKRAHVERMLNLFETRSDMPN